MAKVKNWAYPLDNIGKPTPPVKKAVPVKLPSVQDYLDEQQQNYSNPISPPKITQNVITSGPIYMAQGTWGNAKNVVYQPSYATGGQAPWPTFFEEPVQDEWSPAPPPIKTIPPKPVPGRLYPVINTGARVEKKALRTFKIYVHDEDEWAQKELKIYKLLTNADGFVPGEDALTLHLTDEPTWYYKVEEFYA